MRRTLTLVLVAGAMIATVGPARAALGCAAYATELPSAPEPSRCSFILEQDGDVPFAGTGKWKIYAPLPDVISVGSRHGSEPGGNLGAAVAIGDLDGDGRAEIVAGEPGADGGAGAIQVYDAGLVPRQRFGAVQGASRFGSALALGDLDRDGDLDIVVGAPGDAAAGLGGTVVALDGKTGTELGRYDGAGAPARFGVRVGIGDVDGDGSADVVVGAPGEPGDAGQARIFLGLRFDAAWTVDGLPGDRLGAAIAVADMDLDGRDDLVLGGPGGGGGGGGVVTVTNEGRDRLRVTPRDSFSNAFGQSVSVADFDGDGRPDIVVASQRSQDDGVVRNAVTAVKLPTSGGGIEHVIVWDTQADLGPVTGPTLRVAAGDITGDGRPDVVVSTSSAAGGRADMVLSHQGRLIQTLLRPDVDTDGDADAIALGDLTGDGRPDLVVGSPGASDRTGETADVGAVRGGITFTHTLQGADLPSAGVIPGRALTRITLEAGGADPAGRLQSGFIYATQPSSGP